MEVPLTATIELGMHLTPAFADEVRGWRDGPHDEGLWERTDDEMWEMDLFGGSATLILVECEGVRSLFFCFDDSDAIHPVIEVEGHVAGSEDTGHVTFRVDMGPWEESIASETKIDEVDKCSDDGRGGCRR